MINTHEYFILMIKQHEATGKKLSKDQDLDLDQPEGFSHDLSSLIVLVIFDVCPSWCQ